MVAAALAAAAATAAAAERAQQAAAAAVSAAGGSQAALQAQMTPMPGLPPWMTPPAIPGMPSHTSPKFPAAPGERPPGFHVKSPPSTMSPPAAAAAAAKAAVTAAAQGKAAAAEAAKEAFEAQEELPMKLVRLGDDAERIELTQQELADNDSGLPPKSKSMPAQLGPETKITLEEGCPSLGSMEHGTGECTPCAWFWKPESCLNAEDCRYCHVCPDGELKKRKKQKVAKMRLGLVTPKAKSPVAHTLTLSSLI